ncbi:MAG TPA: hypothetical protein VEM57_01180 [Candidatus Binatus sp.]|nr:hypothetical protein [Candidatus Binatus sp.]
MNGGAGSGQCRAEIALDPTRWLAVGDGGYRYTASSHHRRAGCELAL